MGAKPSVGKETAPKLSYEGPKTTLSTDKVVSVETQNLKVDMEEAAESPGNLEWEPQPSTTVETGAEQTSLNPPQSLANYVMNLTIDHISKDSYEQMFQVHETTGDGNCLFYSLLQSLGVSTNYMLNLRALICEHMRNNRDVYDYFMEDDKTLDQYLDEMSQDAAYGSEPELQAFGEMLNCKIHILVIYPDKSRELDVRTSGIDIGHDLTLFFRLSYDPLTDLANHYENLIPLNQAISGDREKFEKVKNLLLEKLIPFNTNICLGKDSYSQKLGFTQEKIHAIKYLHNNFKIIQNKGKGECTFIALCDSMKIMSTLNLEMRQLVVENISPEIYLGPDIDKYKTAMLNPKEKGGDLELIAFARWAKCKIVIFEEKEQQLYQNGYSFSPEFTIYFLRSANQDGLHLEALNPKNDGLYTNLKAFNAKSSDLMKVLKASFMNHQEITNKISTAFSKDEKLAVDITIPKTEGNDESLYDDDFLSENGDDSGKTLPDKVSYQAENRKAIDKAPETQKIEEEEADEEADTKTTASAPPKKRNTALKNENRRNDDKSLMSDAVKRKAGSRPQAGENLIPDYIYAVKLNNNFTLITKANKDLEDAADKLTLEAAGYNTPDLPLLSKHIGSMMRTEDFSNPKNLIWDIEVPKAQFNKRTGLNDKMAIAIGPCIDIECSGYNQAGKPIFKLYNDLYRFKDHARQFHTMGVGSLINFVKPDNYSIIKATFGANHSWVMMREEDIPLHMVNKCGSAEPSRTESLRIFGWNSRSARTKINRVLLNKFLDSEKPDFLLLNECNDLSKIRLLKGDKYKLISSGTRTGMIYNTTFGVNVVLKDLNDELNQIVRVNSETGDLFIYNLYIPPDERKFTQLNAFLARVLAITHRYVNPKIIIFGDFNMGRDELEKKVMTKIRMLNARAHYDPNPGSFTRIQKNIDKIDSSYLDYFITVNIDNPELQILKPIGRSDHLTLKLECSQENLGKPKIRKQIVYNFAQAKKDAAEIKEELLRLLKLDSRVANITNMIKLLRHKYKPRLKKTRHWFHFTSSIQKYLTEDKNQKWEDLTKVIMKSSTEAYHTFLSKFEEMKLNNQTREYFLRLRFYTELNKSTEPIKDLEVLLPGGEIGVTQDRFEIDDKLLQKYKTLYKDKGSKQIYHSFPHDPVIFSGADVLEAMEEISFDKATGWDYIPGETFKLIRKLKKENLQEYLEFGSNMAKFYNELFNDPYVTSIPEEIMCSRLVCLNKNPDSHGHVDAIRPIAIDGMLIKIAERCLFNKLTKLPNYSNIINPRQIGFRKGLGCDLNLMRLRQRVSDVLSTSVNKEKFLLFVDFKTAFDAVNHTKLFDKLRQKEIPNHLIYAISKIYSSARMRLNQNHAPINLNSGVRQGSILSPHLFNIYIDSLIEQLVGAGAFEVLAYADDIAIICRDEDELNKVIDTLDKWSLENDILINKKKSGVMVIDCEKTSRNDIRGYPVKVNYKYLGVILNAALDPRGSVIFINKKLKGYLSRNDWIVKKFFTPKSLIVLNRYYQESRIIYGLNPFLDMGDVIDIAQKASLKYLRSLLGLKNNVSSRRCRLVFGLPKLEHNLLVRLVKNVKIYMSHFGVFPVIYQKTLEEYRKWACIEKSLISVPADSLKSTVLTKSITDTAGKEGITVGPKFQEIIDKYLFRWPDRRENLLVKYIIKFGFFDPRLFEICKLCGGTNSRTHVTNECTFFDSSRNAALEKIKNILQNPNQLSLEERIMQIYFSPDPGWTKKQIRDLVETVKSFVGNLYMNRKKKPGIEETQVSDDEPQQTARPEEGQNSLDKISSFK